MAVALHRYQQPKIRDMNKILIYISLAILVANILFGAILSCFDTFNVVLSSCVIAITALLLYLISVITMKDAFKVSLSLIFSLIGFIEYLLAVFAPSHFKDNWCLIIVIFLAVLQTALLITTNVVSNKIK